MPHGLRDGALSGRAINIFTAYDIGELAVRLGSIVSFNREGNVIFLDDFNQTLTAWIIDAPSGVADVYPVCYPTVNGGIAICLKTDAPEFSVTAIEHVLHYPVRGGIGLELAFLPVPNFDWLELTVIFYDGVDATKIKLGYDHPLGLIRLYTESDGWITLTTVGTQREADGSFVRIKVVGNILTGLYTRVIFNGVEYDASAYDLVIIDDVIKQSMSILIEAVNTAAGSAEVVIDDVILTQNEPT